MRHFLLTKRVTPTRIFRREAAMRIFFAGLVALAACAMFALRASAQTPATDSERPVIVELFTSEGCSDCPPAEALAMKLEKQPIAGADVIVLEEHVDYWNRQGWVDPFSSVEWTERQQDYVSKLANGNPYTPEMVVEGQSEFVGSNGRAALAAIENAASGAQANVTITGAGADPKGSQEVKISVGKLNGAAAGDVAEVWLAVTEDGLHSAVRAGENAGHNLYHAAVVRSLRKIGVARADGDAAFTGTAQVKLKSGWNPKNMHVVAFVQEKKSRKILGAASAKVAG